jgi:prepilin peptidase CpaA
MVHPFFSDPVFGWIFCGVLVGLTGVASVTDLRTGIVPKWLTITALSLGVIMNIVRGALLGSQGQELWRLETGSAWLGGLDGLLFSLTGFLVGFGVFFVMWVLGTCGGGDVKLLAALGAWLGPVLVVWVIFASVGVLMALVLLKLLNGGFSFQGVQKNVPKPGRKDKKQQAAPPALRRGVLRMTYSFPVALATAVVLYLFLWAELQLPAPTTHLNDKVQVHAT